MSTLLERTKLLLDASPMSLREIAEGAEVGHEWLKKFKAGAIDDPSVNLIQDLHDFLTGHKVKAA